jgi:hypothetical protein
MQHLMRVLLADAKEKHYSYSACKTKVMIIDGTAATFDSEKKFIPSTTHRGKKVLPCHGLLDLGEGSA